MKSLNIALFKAARQHIIHSAILCMFSYNPNSVLSLPELVFQQQEMFYGVVKTVLEVFRSMVLEVHRSMDLEYPWVSGS